MTGLEIFEELRFIIELILAEQMFIWNFAKRKENTIKNNTIGILILMVVSVCFVPLQDHIITWNITVLTYSFTAGWYIFLLFFSLFLIKWSYDITYSDLLFLGISGYTVQHIEYILVNEILAMGIFPELPNYPGIYFVICVVTCCLWYLVVMRIFASKLHDFGDVIYQDKPSTIIYFSALLIMLFFSAFLGQNSFRTGVLSGEVNYRGAVTDLCNCILVLIVQYGVFRISALNKEKEIISQLLHERQKQYNLSKENIEIINQKCHDLKHQLQALKEIPGDDRVQYIQEVEESIQFYDSVLKTNNEVVNTILSEKSLYCEKHNIHLSCIVDAEHLDFMSTMDIYAILGNALDNAIECVRKYSDIEKRIISLTIAAQDSFLCIQTNNYIETELEFENGLPVSIKKKNRAYHGFGMKSMKHLTEKYGGTLYTNIENGIFMLQIILPMPKEFLRLLKENKKSEG